MSKEINRVRANAAKVALMAHMGQRVRKGKPAVDPCLGPDGDHIMAVKDLITDLCHYLRLSGLLLDDIEVCDILDKAMANFVHEN